MKRKLYSTGFFAYILLMLWLLFIRYRGVEVTDYWGQLPERVNLIPFSSIVSMLCTLWHNPYPAVLWTVVYNIGGNIVMFVPLGFFLIPFSSIGCGACCQWKKRGSGSPVPGAGPSSRSLRRPGSG